MLLCRNSTAQLLLFSLTLHILVLLRSSAASAGRNSTRLARPRSGLPPGKTNADYEDFTEEPELHPNSGGPPRDEEWPMCDYDMCQEQQGTCLQLAASTRCLCPGTAGPLDTPDAPHLRRLEQTGSGVVVHWCAPASVVTHYIIRVEGKAPGPEVGEQKRRVELADVPVGTRVCVEAVNKVGHSPEDGKACARNESPKGSLLALKLGIAGGVAGILLLLILLGLLWRHRTQRKAGSRVASDGANGVL